MSLTLVPAFHGPLIFIDEYGLPYSLGAPLIYDSAILKRTVVVPEGFKTDLASIPRVLWNILPKSGSYDRAAVIHDALYAWGGTTPYHDGSDISRADADAVLLEAMEVLKVGWFTRHAVYLGVRAGGWLPWGNYRERDAG